MHKRNPNKIKRYSEHFYRKGYTEVQLSSIVKDGRIGKNEDLTAKRKRHIKIPHTFFLKVMDWDSNSLLPHVYSH